MIWRLVTKEGNHRSLRSSASCITMTVAEMVKLQHLSCPGSAELPTRQKINLIGLAVRDQGHDTPGPVSARLILHRAPAISQHVEE